MTGAPLAAGGLGLDDPGRELPLLARIIDTVTAGLDLEELVQGVTAIITDATATDVCFVHLADQEHGRLVLSGATPPFDRHAGAISLTFGTGVAGWVAAHQEAAVVQDKFSDDRYEYLPELKGEEYASLVSVPMMSGPERLVGVLNVHTRERRDFSEADVTSLRAIADLVAPAVENARLHRRLTQREHARERFAERLVNAQEQERRRLAREIHDGISQRIVGLSYHLTAAAEAITTDEAFAAEQIAAARRLAAAALDETRTAISGLRPSVLDDLGLAASLESLARSLAGVDVELDVRDCELAEHVETALYRITQEAFQNVSKHADATHVVLRLAPGDGHVVLELHDDGRGFDTAAVAGDDETRVAYGLVGMRERADLIDAELTVDSTPGEGTTVRLVVPRSPDSGQPQATGASSMSGLTWADRIPSRTHPEG
ncbi:MAG: GAF domain-containing sensor histidine kinase [Egibacteraceae bacterium]